MFGPPPGMPPMAGMGPGNMPMGPPPMGMAPPPPHGMNAGSFMGGAPPPRPALINTQITTNAANQQGI